MLGVCCCLFLVGVSGGYSSHGMQASHYGGFSGRAWALGMQASVVVFHRLQSGNSLVMAYGAQLPHGRRDPTAGGIFLDQD